MNYKIKLKRYKGFGQAEKFVKRTILSEVFLLENFVEENEASHIFTRNKIFRAEKNLS